MRFALVIIDDGRVEYLRQTVASFNKHLPFSNFATTILINDNNDPTYADCLKVEFPQFDCQVHHSERRGLMGAFLSAWTTALEYEWDFLWHNEDDLVLLDDIDLDTMADLLTKHPHLAQVMLLRQPITPREVAAGGVILSEPDDHHERRDGEWVWTEHDRWYGFNSHIVKRSVVELVVQNSAAYTGPNAYREEQGVTDILKPAGYRFAYWGGVSDDALIDHVGHHHSPGYRI